MYDSCISTVWQYSRVSAQSKFIYNVPLDHIETVDKNIDFLQIFNNWNVVLINCFELTTAESIHVFMNKLKIFDVFNSSRWFPSKWRSRATKRLTLSLIGCLVLSLNVGQLFVQCLKSGSGKTASLHPKGTPLCETAKTVSFINF